LGDSDIRGASGLKTLKKKSAPIARRETKKTDLDTRNTDTNVSSLYHADIIRAVTYSEENGFLVLLDKLDY
jgi:hypothetical protein